MVFTARNRQNPFARRRRAASEDKAAAEVVAAVFDTEPEDVPFIDIKPASAEEPTEHGSLPAESPISPETQAKIEAIVNRVTQPIEPHAATDVDLSAPAPPAAESGQEAPEADEPKRGRGRPRPAETIARDNAVHELLRLADADGISKEVLATRLGEKEQQVYSSLRQLSKEGRAETRYIKGHGYRWFAV